MLPTLALVAVLVLVTRPLVAFLATIGTELSRGERAFTGWMAPRGMSRADVKEFGEVIDDGTAALVVVGESKIEQALDKAALKAEKQRRE